MAYSKLKTVDYDLDFKVILHFQLDCMVIVITIVLSC